MILTTIEIRYKQFCLNLEFCNNNLYCGRIMDSASIELCNGMYKEFSSLVEEMTNLCIESEKQLEEYKQNLHEKIIPEKV